MTGPHGLGGGMIGRESKPARHKKGRMFPPALSRFAMEDSALPLDFCSAVFEAFADGDTLKVLVDFWIAG